MCSSHEIQATLNALGYLEDGEYFKSKDCLNAAKDLARYLRRDDVNEKPVRRELLRSDVISNDLIPLMKILKSKKADAELYDIVLRLLVNLTQSAFNCYEQKVPEDKIHYNNYIEIDTRLKSVKESFADEDFVKTISQKLDELINKDWQDRPEEEELIIERLLYLIRNILLIKPSDEEVENRLSTDLNSHDLLLLSFHKANLFKTIMSIAATHKQSKYAIHLLEIVTLILRDQSAEEIARVSDNEINLNSKRSLVEKEKDNDELTLLQMRDSQTRKHNKIRLNPRHSRFMGTYVAVNMKSINDENKLIVHKQARNVADLLDDSSKRVIKKGKNKLVFESEQERKSVLFIRVILKQFCSGFMNESYGAFFKNLKDLMNRKKFEDDETCHFYWLVQFFTEFVRNSDYDEIKKISLVKETFCMELFHSIEIFIQRCKEMMKVEKKQDKLWAKRMHTSFKCYKESLITLFTIEKRLEKFRNDKRNEQSENLIDLNWNESENRLTSLEIKTNENLLDEKSFEILARIKNQIFYIQEFRELFIYILKDFDHSKMSKSFLRDLIEGNHIFISMLKHHTKTNGSVNVGSKKKKKKQKSKKPKVKETKEEKDKRLQAEKEYEKRVEQQNPTFKQKTWEANFSKLAPLIQNNEPLNIQEDNLMPFDFVATNDEEFDNQKIVVIEKIQRLLVENKPDDSLALFREARFLWPNDSELFGSPQIQADEEFETYKRLFMKQIEIEKKFVDNQKETRCDDETANKNKESDEGLGEDIFKDDGEEEERNFTETEGNEENDEEDEEEKTSYVIEEESLEIEKFLFRYTHPHILKCYILMLGEYLKNSDFLNRCCMSMFEHIAYDCHATQCLYQLSLFNLINKIYKDPLSRSIMNILHKKSLDVDIYASSYTVEDMFAFFRQVLNKFFEQAQKNPLLYVELLFFKDKKSIHELGETSNGYEPIETGKKTKVAWTQEEQDELKQLFNRLKIRFDKTASEEQMEPNEEDILEEQHNLKDADLIDLVLFYLKNGNRKRKDVCNQLVNIGCVKSMDEFKPGGLFVPQGGKKNLGRNKLWRPEDLDDLRKSFELIKKEAFEENKPLSEVFGKLQACLKVKRNRKAIVEQLFKLDLIKDEREIFPKSKKLTKKQTFSSNDLVNTDEDSSNSSSEIEDEEEENHASEQEKYEDDNMENLFEQIRNNKKDRGRDEKSNKEKRQKEKTKKRKQTVESKDQEAISKNNETNSDNESELSLALSDEDEAPEPFMNELSQEKAKKRKEKERNKYRILYDTDEDGGYTVQSSDSGSREKSDEEIIISKKRKKSTGQKRAKLLEEDGESSNQSVQNESPTNAEMNKLTSDNKNVSGDEDDDDDNDFQIGPLASKPKRQRLLLSESDED